jgi:transposase
VHEAIKSARDLQNKNAELAARLAVSEEQIRLLREQSQKVQPLQIQIEQLKNQVSHYCERAVLLEEELRWLKAQVFGRAAPHHSPDTAADQRMLFNEAEVLTAIEAADVAHANRKTTIAGYERQHTGGRKAIPEAFPRKNIPHDIGEDEKFCPHDGTALERFGEETSERYAYRRPKIWVERHIRHRYGCPTCRSGEAIKIAPVPAQLLPKTNAGASLLAHLIANKFVDGIPIYRTCGQLERLGMDLSPGTAGTWINAAGDKMTALVQLMHEELLTTSFIHMDETYLQVLKSDKAPTSTHYMVVRAGGPPGKRIVLFNYVASRTVEALKHLLIGPNGPYQGKLLTDGLELYDSVVEALSLRHYGCLAHCRQYFDKAAKVTELPSGRSLARVALEEYLGKVYAVERKVKALRKAAEHNGIAQFPEILALRQKEAAPIMAAFKKWVDDLLPGVPPKTALGKALAYTTRQWAKLQRFLSDPEIPAGRVEMWRGDIRFLSAVAAAFTGGVSIDEPSLRFHIPLVEPDMQVSRIRLSRMSLRPSRSPRPHDFLAVGRGRASRRDTRLGTGGTRCRAALVVGSAIAADAGRCIVG